MKLRIRRPSLRKRIAARTSVKRAVRAKVRAPRGFGWLTNPRKALYNRIYRRTSIGCVTLPLALLLLVLATAFAACGPTPTPMAASPTPPGATATNAPPRLPADTGPLPATVTPAVEPLASPTSVAVAPSATRAQAAVTATSTPRAALPSQTPLPKELQDRIAGAYGALVFVQASAQSLKETANNVQTGKVQGMDGLGAVIGVAVIVGATDSVLAAVQPPDLLAAKVAKGRELHAQTKDIVKRWMDNAIKPDQALKEVEPVLREILTVMKEAEEVLGKTYGFDAATLTKEREAAINTLAEQLIPRTPTPK